MCDIYTYIHIFFSVSAAFYIFNTARTATCERNCQNLQRHGCVHTHGQKLCDAALTSDHGQSCTDKRRACQSKRCRNHGPLTHNRILTPINSFPHSGNGSEVLWPKLKTWRKLWNLVTWHFLTQQSLDTSLLVAEDQKWWICIWEGAMCCLVFTDQFDAGITFHSSREWGFFSQAARGNPPSAASVKYVWMIFIWHLKVQSVLRIWKLADSCHSTCLLPL